MFGPTSIMGYILVDLPVELGNDFWFFAQQRNLLEYGLLNFLRREPWLQHFCYCLSYAVLVIITFGCLRFVDYIIAVGFRMFDAWQARKKAKAEKILLPDNLVESEDPPSAFTIRQILDPQKRLPVEFNTNEGKLIYLDLYITAKENGRPVLHNFCSSEAIKSIAISKGPSKPVYHENDDILEVPLRIMCKIKFTSGPKILLLVSATKMVFGYPGWMVSDQQVGSQKYFPDASEGENRQFLDGYY